MQEQPVEFAYVVYKDEDGNTVVTDDIKSIVMGTAEDDVLLSPKRRCTGSDYALTANEISEDMLAQKIVQGMMAAQMSIAQQMAQQRQQQDIMNKMQKSGGLTGEGLIVP